MIFKSILLSLLTVVLVLILGFDTKWSTCKTCGVQQYERSIFGVVIEYISQKEYDEFGSYKTWKLEHNLTKCVHIFEIN